MSAEIGAISQVDVNTPLLAENHISLKQSTSIQSEPKDNGNFHKSAHFLQQIRVFVLIMVTSIPALLVGCTLGFPSAAIIDLHDDEKRPDYRLNNLLSDVFGAMGPVGAIFGGPIAGWIADAYGRKMALLLVLIPYFGGYLMITYAHFISNPVGFKSVLLFGRFFTGVGLGWSCLASPVYAAEVSSSKIRGVFSSFFQLFLSLGLVVVYFMGSFDNFYYYDVSLVLLGILTFYSFLVVMICETPRWLLVHGYRSEAISSLKILRGQHSDINFELNAIENEISRKPKSKIILFQSLKQFRKREVMLPMLIVVFIMFFNQIGGLNARTAYSAEIFEEAQLHNPKATAAYAVGAVSTAFTFISLFLVERFGRKLLLLISAFGMFTATILLGTYFYVTHRHTDCHGNSTLFSSKLQSPFLEHDLCKPEITPLAVASIMLFSAAYSIGWGPIAFVLMGELIPLNVKGIGSGIATLVNWSTASIVAGFYLSYSEKVGAYTAWWTFSFFNGAAILFVAMFVFETKGKTLEEIQTFFHKK